MKFQKIHWLEKIKEMNNKVFKELKLDENINSINWKLFE